MKLVGGIPIYTEDVVILHTNTDNSNTWCASACPSNVDKEFLEKLKIDVVSIIDYDNFKSYPDDYMLSHVSYKLLYKSYNYVKENIDFDLFKNTDKEFVRELFSRRGWYGPSPFRIIRDNIDYIYDCASIKDIIE